MKTPLQKLIEQLEEKIEKANKHIKIQDEVGIYVYGGVLAGFSEAKLIAENLLEYELKFKNIDL